MQPLKRSRPVAWGSVWSALILATAWLALASLSLAWSSGPLQAQKSATPDAPQLAAAKAFLEATGQAKNFDAMMPMMANQMVELIGKGSPDKIGQIRETVQQLMPKFLARKQELFDELALLYAGQLSIGDMQAATTFFKSEAGQRFVAMQPQLMQQSMVIGQRWGQKVGQQLELEMRQELKKRGITL
jgi:uncharacterized protein